MGEERSAGRKPPEHPHGPDWVPPGQGGTPPGEDKPEKPEKPGKPEEPEDGEGEPQPEQPLPETPVVGHHGEEDAPAS